MKEMLLSLDHLLLQTFRVNGDQSIYTGHTVLYANDNTRFITKLPLTVPSLDVIVALRRNRREVTGTARSWTTKFRRLSESQEQGGDEGKEREAPGKRLGLDCNRVSTGPMHASQLNRDPASLLYAPMPVVFLSATAPSSSHGAHLVTDATVAFAALPPSRLRVLVVPRRASSAVGRWH
jgi:hypothetical protein